ncbi:uncharacterized protein LOC126293633 [Schistocerca gregaria]|uniref:uncharacterized protein LOC126293633 n=1 Tax=Schistocerca gregaria TaxID=7010 RepID=UPI00211F19C6|nr:uncharacterized protein LOC126293633 [Schistocerca gregaria]
MKRAVLSLLPYLRHPHHFHSPPPRPTASSFSLTPALRLWAGIPTEREGNGAPGGRPAIKTRSLRAALCAGRTKAEEAASAAVALEGGQRRDPEWPAASKCRPAQIKCLPPATAARGGESRREPTRADNCRSDAAQIGHVPRPPPPLSSPPPGAPPVT